MDWSEWKKRVMDRVDGQPWLRGVGIGLMRDDGGVGVVVSVSEAGGGEARELLAEMAEEIPIDIRVMGLVQPRPGQVVEG